MSGTGEICENSLASLVCGGKSARHRSLRYVRPASNDQKGAKLSSNRARLRNNVQQRAHRSGVIPTRRDTPRTQARNRRITFNARISSGKSRPVLRIISPPLCQSRPKYFRVASVLPPAPRLPPSPRLRWTEWRTGRDACTTWARPGGLRGSMRGIAGRRAETIRRGRLIR
jgi:hypothetical protein